jgi:hypothetical protein
MDHDEYDYEDDDEDDVDGRYSLAVTDIAVDCL